MVLSKAVKMIILDTVEEEDMQLTKNNWQYIYLYITKK